MFGTSGVRGTFGADVTADLALSIGRAVVSEDADRIVLGRDPRTTGPLLADALAAGAMECGADVIDLGVAATPTIARSVGWRDADAGVAVTASHNPPEDNGLKLWQPTGQAYDDALQGAITERVQTDSYQFADWDAVGERSTWDGAAQRHVAAITAGICDAQERLRAPDGDGPLDVVVDVGNGAGGVVVPALRELGCSVHTLDERPDGHFPSRPSEPTAETVQTLRETVPATGAHLGVAHDGDADRMMAVDERGRFVPGDALLAVFALDAVEPGGTIAAPLNTSLAVDDMLAERDVSVARTPVGDVFVAARASQPGVDFGGEPSGSWIWPEATLCPDGPQAACRLAALVADRGPLSTLVDDVPSYPLRREAREVADKQGVMTAVRAAAIDRYDDVSEIDGVRVDTGNGWLLVRPSGTQSLVRVTAEARDVERAEELLAEGHALVDEALAS